MVKLTLRLLHAVTDLAVLTTITSGVSAAAESSTSSSSTVIRDNRRYYPSSLLQNGHMHQSTFDDPLKQQQQQQQQEMRVLTSKKKQDNTAAVIRDNRRYYPSSLLRIGNRHQHVLQSQNNNYQQHQQHEPELRELEEEGNDDDDDGHFLDDGKPEGVRLDNLWYMSEPDLQYVGDQTSGDVETTKFRLKFTVSDMIDESMFSATWWTPECPSKGATPIEQDGIGYRFEYSSDGKPAGNGTGTRIWEVAFEGAPTLLTNNTDIYREYYENGAKYGMAEVCVRTSLGLPSNGIEVNYKEHRVQIQYYFTQGFFVVQSFGVLKPEAKVDTISMGSIMNAYDCSSQSSTKSQGMVLKVCIEPINSALIDGYRMKAIESFKYEKYSSTDSDALPFVQNVVVNGSQVENELSRLVCQRGGDQCTVEAILYARFFNEPGPVSGNGVATMQLGNYTGEEATTAERRRLFTVLQRWTLLEDEEETTTTITTSLFNWKKTVRSFVSSYIFHNGDDDDDDDDDYDDNHHLRFHPTDHRRRYLQDNTPAALVQDPLFGIDRTSLPDEIGQEFDVEFNLDNKTFDGSNSWGRSRIHPSCRNFAEQIYHTLSGFVGIGILLLLNIGAIVMLIFQFPNFYGSRLYLGIVNNKNKPSSKKKKHCISSDDDTDTQDDDDSSIDLEDLEEDNSKRRTTKKNNNKHSSKHHHHHHDDDDDDDCCHNDKYHSSGRTLETIMEKSSSSSFKF